MTESFKQQLQELIERAAEKFDERNNQETDYYCPYSFKQGCEFLMPVLIKAVEQRNNQCIAMDSLGRYRMNNTIENFDKELLNILKEKI